MTWRAISGRPHATALLPANAFNSEPPFFQTFQTPQQQPVLHLMGENAMVRKGIFGRMWR